MMDINQSLLDDQTSYTSITELDGLGTYYNQTLTQVYRMTRACWRL